MNLLKSESRAFNIMIMGTMVCEIRHTRFNMIFAFSVLVIARA